MSPIMRRDSSPQKSMDVSSSGGPHITTIGPHAELIGGQQCELYDTDTAIDTLGV